MKVLLEPLQGAMRRALEFDPDTRARVADLNGRTVEITLTGVEQSVCVMIEGETVLLSDAADGAPDLRLKGTPIAFARYVMAPDRMELTDSGINIEGDIGLAQRFVGVLREIDIDWEEWASRYVGDVAAHRAGRFVEGFRAWALNSRRQVQQDITEYLQEEVRLLAPRMRVQHFMNDVDELRSDVERLSQRVRRLRNSR